MTPNDLWQILLITLIPTLELRASLPYAILVLNLPWHIAFLWVVLINILLAPLVYFSLRAFLHIFIKIPLFRRIYEHSLLKVQSKVRPKVEKYGDIGLALFIGIPLPGSGVYTGALAAFILDIRPRNFLISSIIGVLIAAVVVLAVVLSGSEFFQWIIK
jgi:uncharacterized membrane protein